ncbi:MAG: type II toxin-antitoxin system HicB family antitoxin [Thermoanaerobaculaceae bacterium]
MVLSLVHIQDFPGAHRKVETLDELQTHLRKVMAMLLEDGEPSCETEFIGTPAVEVA